MEEKINRGKEVVVEKLNLPADVVLDMPKITVLGNKEIVIENHKGIKYFDKDKIEVKTKIGVLMINGVNFEILYIGGETITIGGIFRAIYYEGASV